MYIQITRTCLENPRTLEGVGGYCARNGMTLLIASIVETVCIKMVYIPAVIDIYVHYRSSFLISL